jgi:hypothetical protein
MIDLARERLPALEAAAERPQAIRATVYGWITRGASGVEFEAAEAGGSWRTSEEALQRFSDRLTGEQQAPPATTHQTPSPLTPPRTSRQQERHQNRVQDQLDEIFGVRKCEAHRAMIRAPWVPSRRASASGARSVWSSGAARPSAKRFPTFRWAALLPQKDLAAQTGIGRDNIRAFEYDEKRLTDEQLARRQLNV